MVLSTAYTTLGLKITLMQATFLLHHLLHNRPATVKKVSDNLVLMVTIIIQTLGRLFTILAEANGEAALN